MAICVHCNDHLGSGGMVGYGMGALLFDTIDQWLIHVSGYGDKMAAFKETYARWGALVILIKRLTPIPSKLVTIVSRLLRYFPRFVLLCVITRGRRFFLLAGALNHLGDPSRVALKRHFAWFLVLMGGQCCRWLLYRHARSLSVFFNT
jgi:hypothetical protein